MLSGDTREQGCYAERCAAPAVSGNDVKKILKTPFRTALVSATNGTAEAGTTAPNCGNERTKSTNVIKFNQTVFELSILFIIGRKDREQPKCQVCKEFDRIISYERPLACNSRSHGGVVAQVRRGGVAVGTSDSDTCLTTRLFGSLLLSFSLADVQDCLE